LLLLLLLLAGGRRTLRLRVGHPAPGGLGAGRERAVAGTPQTDQAEGEHRLEEPEGLARDGRHGDGDGHGQRAEQVHHDATRRRPGEEEQAGHVDELALRRAHRPPGEGHQPHRDRQGEEPEADDDGRRVERVDAGRRRDGRRREQDGRRPRRRHDDRAPPGGLRGDVDLRP
jgi:hypothetical protein